MSASKADGLKPIPVTCVTGFLGEYFVGCIDNADPAQEL